MYLDRCVTHVPGLYRRRSNVRWSRRLVVPFVILTGALHGQQMPRTASSAALTPGGVAGAMPADTAPPVRG